MLAASTLTVMAGAAVAPALPAMQAHFGHQEHAALLVRLVLTLPALVIALVAPVAGYLVDRWGGRTILAAGVVLYTCAGASGLLLDTLPAILAGRALLGLAVAAIMVSATGLLAGMTEGAERVRMMGLQATSMALGGVAFLMLGGVFAAVSWRGPFAVYLLALLVLPGTVSLPADRTSPADSCTEASIGLHGASRRLLPGLYAAAFAGMLAFYLTPTQVPFLVAQRVSHAPLLAAAAIAVSTLSAAAASLTFGRVRARVSPPLITAMVFALMGSGYLATGLLPGYIPILAGMAVLGLGLGMLMPNLNTWLAAEVPPALRGRVLGGLTTSVFLGQFLSPILGQPILERLGLAGMFTVVGAGCTGAAIVLGIAAAPRTGRIRQASPVADSARAET